MKFKTTEVDFGGFYYVKLDRKVLKNALFKGVLATFF